MPYLEGKYIRAYKALIRELSDPDNSDIAEFQEAYVEIKKCLNCDKYTILGKTCNGVCDKED